MSQQILHLENWAYSAGGHTIELWSSIHNDERPLLFIGGVHGDEPEGVQLAQDFLLWLQNQQQDKLRSWLLIPCLNPDGFLKNQRVNAHGVDLNRNFPSQDWSPDFKSQRYYPGPKAGSEPETKALVRLLENKQPQIILHFHSWQPCVVYTGELGKRAAQILSPGPHYPAREEIGYPTPGSLGQYGWLNLKTPVICIEEQEKSPLNLAWQNFGPGLQKLMNRTISL